jgi:hypothetical protein
MGDRSIQPMPEYSGKLAVLHNEQYALNVSQALADRLAVPLYLNVDKNTAEDFFEIDEINPLLPLPFYLSQSQSLKKLRQ